MCQFIYLLPQVIWQIGVFGISFLLLHRCPFSSVLAFAIFFHLLLPFLLRGDPSCVCWCIFGSWHLTATHVRRFPVLFLLCRKRLKVRKNWPEFAGVAKKDTKNFFAISVSGSLGILFWRKKRSNSVRNILFFAELDIEQLTFSAQKDVHPQNSAVSFDWRQSASRLLLTSNSEAQFCCPRGLHCLGGTEMLLLLILSPQPLGNEREGGVVYASIPLSPSPKEFFSGAISLPARTNSGLPDDQNPIFRIARTSISF